MKSKSVLKKKVSSERHIEELLVDLFDRYEDTFEQYQWPRETQRWYELVYCLISAVENRFGPDTHSASAVRVLMELGLLDIPLLAKAEETTGQQLRIVLERLSFSGEQAKQLARALFDLAKCLDDKFQGRVQILLRTFSIMMVDQVIQTLPLKNTLGKEKASLAVMHWLQNVLNLPVLVPSPGLKALLAETGAKSEEVLAAADKLNVNVALVDEILNRWIGDYPSQKPTGEPQEMT